ncbi:unnamed protein product [Auanema sp. JU1783]|nr:unnamed protein product [Auanema sp. JU1783]
MANAYNEELLLEINHVKYRKAGEGRSPIGRLLLYSEHIQWEDNAGGDVLYVKFIQIKGQRVSAATKPKVQLQLCLQNEDQATFVFLDPSKSRDQLLDQRDALKETLQQSLIDHRAKVNQLAASQEQGSVHSELETKQRILQQNKQLQLLYQHLVASKLITPQDFWVEYYKQPENGDEKTGVNGAFLSSIATQDGTKGVKLNLNAEIIQAIFNTYPAVERKHLELVPHEMPEEQFWSKFFQSHYYHRQREVLPNPHDPFADCVKFDDLEIKKLVNEGVKRKRFDLDHLSDNLFDSSTAKEALKTDPKTTLVRRCNYLSERIIATLAKNTTNQTSSNSKKTEKEGSGFSILNRIIDEEETRLESDELTQKKEEQITQVVKINSASRNSTRTYLPEEAIEYKRIVLNFIDDTTDEDILSHELPLFEDDDTNGFPLADQNSKTKKVVAKDWNLTPQEFNEVRILHDSCNEVLKHFWSCFPPITQELEEKMARMDTALRQLEEGQLSKAALKYGPSCVEHSFLMISKAHERYQSFLHRKKK